MIANIKRTPVLLMYLTLVALLPLLYIEPLHNPSALPRHALVALTASLAVLLLALSMWQGKQQFQWHMSQLIALIFLFFASLSSLWSIESGSSLIAIMYLSSFVLIFLVATQLNKIDDILLIAVASVTTAGLAALIGILQNFDLNPLGYRNLVMASTFIYKNHAALFFDLVVPVAFFLIFSSDNKTIKWISAVSFGLCLGYLVESRTRGSYLSMGVIFLILVLIWLFNKSFRSASNQKLKQNYVYIIVSILVAAAAVIPPGRNDSSWERKLTPMQGPIQKQAPELQKELDQSAMDRLLFYRNSLGIIVENPLLGTGYGTFWKAFRPHMNYPYVIQRSDENIYLLRLHNDILQFFTELGLLGGGTILAFFIFVITTGIRFVFRDGREGGKTLMVAGLVLAVLASLIHALVDFPFHKPSSAALIWLWSGLIVAASLSTRPDRNIIHLPRITGQILFIFAALYLIINTLFYRAYLIDNHYLILAEQDIKANRCPAAMHNIEKANSSFGLYLVTHIIRTRIHVICNQNPQQLFNLLNHELKRDDTNTLALLKRAELYLVSDYYDEAEQDYQRVIRILPHRISGKLGLVRVLLKKGEIEQASKLLEKIRVDYPGDETAPKLLQEAQNRRKFK